MMCKIKSCAGLHLFKAAILCSQRNYLNDIDPLARRSGNGAGAAAGSGGSRPWDLRLLSALSQGRRWSVEAEG